MRFEKTRLADEDIIHIYIFGYLNFGPHQAEKYIHELSKTFSLLAKTPYVAQERKEFDPPVRIHHHERHLIVYRIEDDYILIIRVLHDSMDIKRHL